MSLTWQTLLWWPTLPKLLLWKWQLPFGNTIQLSQTIECLEETWTWLQLYAPSRSRYATICSMLVLFFTRYLRSRHQACVSNTFKSCKSGARFLCHSTSHFIATFGGVQLTICSIVHMPYTKWVTTHVLIPEHSWTTYSANHHVSQVCRWLVWTCHHNILTGMNHKEDTMGCISFIRWWMSVSEGCKGFIKNLFICPSQYDHHNWHSW